MVNRKFLSVSVWLILILFLATLIRSWHFTDWLIFKMDQARDFKLVERAYLADNGKLSIKSLAELPLLGPRAAGSFLRLGPIFYYFQYLSLSIFGDQPWAAAVPDFLFSLLAIPLFYYFLRLGLGRRTSLLFTALFASSFFLNQYGRFAWNPNSLPFWSLVYFISLYKFAFGDWRWLPILALGYGVVSQLHFVALLIYPLIGIIFLATIFFWRMITNNNIFQVKQTKRWKVVYFLIAIFIFSILYLPMFFSELCTQGDNWRQFQYVFTKHSQEDITLQKKIKKSILLHSDYFWFTLTGHAGRRWWNIVLFIGLFLWLFGTAIRLLFNLWVKHFKDPLKQRIGNIKAFSSLWSFLNSKQKIDKGKVNKAVWLWLVSLWLIITFAVYTKLVGSIKRPRYWLLLAPAFLALSAFSWTELLFWWQRLGRYCAQHCSQLKRGEWPTLMKRLLEKSGYLIIIGFIFSNLLATGFWYQSLQTKNKERIATFNVKLKDRDLSTWQELQAVADYLADLQRTEPQKNVCYYAAGEYRAVYRYLFKNRYHQSQIREILFQEDNNDNCLFVSIDHGGHRDKLRLPRDHRAEFKPLVNGRRDFGLATVWRIEKIDGQILAKSSDKMQEVTKENIKSTNKNKLTSEELVTTQNDQNLNNDNYQDNAYSINNNQSNQGGSEEKNINQRESQEKIAPGSQKIESQGEQDDSKVKQKDEQTKKEKKPRRKERLSWKDLAHCAQFQNLLSRLFPWINSK